MTILENIDFHRNEDELVKEFVFGSSIDRHSGYGFKIRSQSDSLYYPWYTASLTMLLSKAAGQNDTGTLYLICITCNIIQNSLST